MAMIETHDLRKSYKSGKTTVEAVRGVNLQVNEGEIFGFLGPNGAGKTTTLRMLTTLLPPTSGEATVAGYDLQSEPRNVRRRIGYVS
jgi:ABC-2 type transport system ATP-binding protein